VVVDITPYQSEGKPPGVVLAATGEPPVIMEVRTNSQRMVLHRGSRSVPPGANPLSPESH
jgi:hypothetical protein